MGRGTAGFGNRHDFHMDGFSQALSARAHAALSALADSPGTTVYVVSGLRVTAVDALGVAALPGIGLAAENGMFVSHPWRGAGAEGGGERAPSPPPSPPLPPQQHRLPQHSPLARERSLRGASVFGGRWGGEEPGPGEGLCRPNWLTTGLDTGASASATLLPQWEAVKRASLALMREYEARINGSVLREYGSFVAWDFRAVDAEWAAAQARFLAADLEAAIREGGPGFARDEALDSVSITLRKTRVEVSLRYWNKGRLAGDILARVGEGAGFVLAIGDDATDEDTFASVAAWREGACAVAAACGRAPPAVFTATVGRKAAADTKAAAYVADVPSVHALLAELAALAR